MFPGQPHRNRAPAGIVVEDELPDDRAVFGPDLEAIVVLDDSHCAHQSAAPGAFRQIAQWHNRGGLFRSTHDATRCHDGPGVAVGRSASKADLMPTGATAGPYIRGRAKSKVRKRRKHGPASLARVDVGQDRARATDQRVNGSRGSVHITKTERRGSGGSTCCAPFRHRRVVLWMSWPQRHQVRLQLFPLVLAGLASQHLGERMYGLFAGPHDLCQINQAFMAAPPAAHLEQFAAASNRIGDPGRRLGRSSR